MTHPFRILLDSQGGSEGGGSSSNQGGSASDPSEGFRKLLEKTNNDGMRLAEKLYGENYQLREKLRQAEGKALADNAVVLSEDDAKRWNAYRELGELPELRKAVSERDQLRDQNETYRRKESTAEVAEVARCNPAALWRLTKQDGLEYEIKVERQQGEDVKVVYVKDKDDKGVDVLTPFDKFVSDKAPEMIPALREGQKVEPALPNGMPPRRDPPANPPPPGDGANPAYNRPPAGAVIQRM